MWSTAKKGPHDQFEWKKFIINQHFYIKNLNKKNPSFKIQISKSSHILFLPIRKKNIYKFKWLGSMLIPYPIFPRSSHPNNAIKDLYVYIFSGNQKAGAQFWPQK